MADLIVYAGSLVPDAILAGTQQDSKIHDSSRLSLEETHALLREGARQGQIIARVHTGDPSLYSAIQEQIRLLENDGIPFEVVPGVTAAFAAAAALARELTEPGGSQTLIITRLSGRTPVPERENLAALARHRATLVIYLSISRMEEVVQQLRQGYPAQTPVVVAYRVGWPDQAFIEGTLADIADRVAVAGITRQAVIMVGRTLRGLPPERSKLYHPAFSHGFRQAGKPESQTSRFGLGVFALTASGGKIAARLAEALPDCTLYLPQKEASRFPAAEPFTDLVSVLARSFSSHRGLVCVMAAGIVFRLVAPLLAGKSQDPAVVVVDEAGRFAVSLVSGHLGGANELAEQVAAVIGGQAVITTATDVQRKAAVDRLAKEADLDIENLDRVKSVHMGFLENRIVGLFDPGERLLPLIPAGVNLRVLTRTQEAAEGDLAAWIYVHEGTGAFEPPPCLILRPRTLVVGLGCNRGTSAGEINAALEEVFRAHNLSLGSVRNLATVELKRGEPGLWDAAAERGWPVTYYSLAELGSGGPVPTPSETVSKHLGIESVCEQAAMLGAGTRELLVPKVVFPNVTVAVARVGSS